MALKEKFERELLFFTDDRMKDLKAKNRDENPDLKMFETFHNAEKKKYELSIADIRFVFNHSKLIPLLKKRGI